MLLLYNHRILIICNKIKFISNSNSSSSSSRQYKEIKIENKTYLIGWLKWLRLKVLIKIVNNSNNNNNSSNNRIKIRILIIIAIE